MIGLQTLGPYKHHCETWTLARVRCPHKAFYPLTVLHAAPFPPWQALDLICLACINQRIFPCSRRHPLRVEAPAPAARASRTLSTGLDRKPSMPAARHSSRSRSHALAVMATIGSAMPARRITCAAGTRQTLSPRRPRSLPFASGRRGCCVCVIYSSGDAAFRDT